MTAIEVQEADMVLPDEFSQEDLASPAYGEPLAEAAKEITEQNGRLIARTACADFRPAIELEYAGNGAHDFIHEFFEAVARYEEGRVPACALGEMVATTEMLLETLETRADAPVMELDAVRVAFRKANILWARTLPHPRRTRKAYLKEVFGHEREIGKALETLHQAYVKASISEVRTPRRQCCRHDLTVPGARQRADDRARVFQAIGTLRGKGLSVSKAIRQLRQNAIWRVRLGNLSDATWRIYYSNRNRHAPD